MGVSYRRNHDGVDEGSCWFFAAVALCARLYERHGCVLFDCRYVPSGGILAINWTRLPLYVVQDNFWSAPVGLLMKET